MNPNPGGKKERSSLLAPLTSFRFFAAMAIVIYHTILWGHGSFGYLRSGVSFFYVLSGFILTYVHPHVDGLVPTLRFWINRIGRIWPLHLFTLVIVICFYSKLPTVKYPHLELFLNMFLLQAWIPVQHILFSFNSVSWSLSVELFFYLIFPFLLPFVSKAPVKVLIAAFIPTLFLIISGAWVNPTLGREISYPDFIIFNPVMNLYKFVFGMAVGVWWMASPKTPAFRPWVWVEIVAFIGVFCIVPMSDNVAHLLTNGHRIQQMERPLQDFLCVPFFGLLIYIFAYQKGALARILSQKWLVFLGDISFSIYMLQGLYKLFNVELPNLSVEWCLYVAILIFCSGLTYVFLEKPARRWIVRLADPMLKKVSIPVLYPKASLD